MNAVHWLDAAAPVALVAPDDVEEELHPDDPDDVAGHHALVIGDPGDDRTAITGTEAELRHWAVRVLAALTVPLAKRAADRVRAGFPSGIAVTPCEPGRAATFGRGIVVRPGEGDPPAPDDLHPAVLVEWPSVNRHGHYQGHTRQWATTIPGHTLAVRPVP